MLVMIAQVAAVSSAGATLGKVSVAGERTRDALAAPKAHGQRLGASASTCRARRIGQPQ
jgi:hypothetical protein